ALEAGYDGGGQRGEEGLGAGQYPQLGADDRAGEDGPQPGEAGGEDPRDGGQAPDRDAEQDSPVVGVGGTADGDPVPAPGEEEGQADQHQRDDDHGQDAVAVEGHREHVELRAERGGEGGEGADVAEEVGQVELGRPQDLGQTNGGDGKDEARSLEEGADDREGDEGSGAEGEDHADRDGQQVRKVPADHHDDGDRRGQAADLGLGEVNDAGRAV